MARKIILRTAALLISVLSPVIAILSYFPLWESGAEDKLISGFTALLLLLAAVPVYKLISRILASPSAWLMWLVIFIIFLLLSRIAEEMVVISFVGFLSNAIGAVLFKLARVGEK